MFTSVLTMALGLGMAQTGPTWTTDYAQAQQQGAAQQKALAVFVGKGVQGWKQVVQGGSLSPEAQNALEKSFLCVYVDAATPQGETLAKAFEINGSGLVVSDRTGGQQAFWHQGELSSANLDQVLSKVAGAATIRTTETLRNGRISFYPPETPAGTTTAPAPYCPYCQGVPRTR